MSDSIDPHLARAKEICDELSPLYGGHEEVIALIQSEPIEVLIRLEARLASINHPIARLAPSVQAIIDRRLHSDQISSQAALRSTMENVSNTLQAVEKNQRRIEIVGVFVGVVGVVLAALQLWTALQPDPPTVGIVGRARASDGAAPNHSATTPPPPRISDSCEGVSARNDWEIDGAAKKTRTSPPAIKPSNSGV